MRRNFSSITKINYFIKHGIWDEIGVRCTRCHRTELILENEGVDTKGGWVAFQRRQGGGYKLENFNAICMDCYKELRDKKQIISDTPTEPKTEYL